MEKKPRSAIAVQVEHLRSVIQNKPTYTFGIEKTVRLFLVLIQFCLPVLYTRELSGRHSALLRKRSVEYYAMAKLILPIVILSVRLQSSPLIIFVIAYLMFDTVVYLLGIVFMEDIYVAPVSYKRSLILVTMNYVEVGLDYAVLYWGLHAVSKIQDPITSVYFSFVTSLTIGFGDYAPDTTIGKVLVILQGLTFLLFIVIFFTHFAANLSRNAFSHNKGRKP